MTKPEAKHIATPRRMLGAVLVALMFGVVLCLPAARLPLWLDEILQLLGTRDLTFKRLLIYIAENAGGVPLGYVVQSMYIQLVGYSALAARVPSIVFGVLSCVGIGMLAQEARLRRSVTAVFVFAVLPLQMRYAAEARPYEQALCLSIWSSLLFIRIVRRPGIAVAVCYAVIVAGAVYTQPFTLFVPLSHLIWAVSLLKTDKAAELRRAVVYAGIATLLAGFAFLPWFVFAHGHWNQAIASAKTGAGIDLKTPLLILHEITGAGFPGVALIGILICAGLTTNQHTRSVRLFWGLAAVLPIVFTLIADVKFGYFFAVRQILFVLPAWAILAGFGIDAYMEKQKRVAGCILTALVVTLLYSDWHFFSKPRENWEQAARVAKGEIRSGACFLTIPESSRGFFEFFYPSLGSERCLNPADERRDEIIVAISPYASADETKQSVASLYAAKFSPAERDLSRLPAVRLWRRAGHFAAMRRIR